MSKIQMVDLQKQYQRLKTEIDDAIFSTIESAQFIKGNQLANFQVELANYMGIENVIGCANGTDALQIALMALNLKKGDEVILPAFTYVATAEAVGLLGLKPVMVDVDPLTFNINSDLIAEAISEKTKLIVPVHLFGQCADMEPILRIASENGLSIVEDTAQAIGSVYTFANGHIIKAGCMGDVGTISFFPSKNLGCYGDGGAICTNNVELTEKMRMIANHGQSVQYVHDIIGINSRLDGLQAAILRVKLRQLDDFEKRRNAVADHYDNALSGIPFIEIPFRQPNSTHVFHQYTIKVKDNQRDNLKSFLEKKGIPSMIYYPMPLHQQKAFKDIGKTVGNLAISTQLCKEVLSIPIHTEMDATQLEFITNNIQEFFERK